jgi:hypothetical protein
LATPRCRSVPPPHGRFCMSESMNSEGKEIGERRGSNDRR